jgi:hypothetical protein
VQLFQTHDQKISGVGEESWAFLVGRYIYKVLQQLHGDGSSFGHCTPKPQMISDELF